MDIPGLRRGRALQHDRIVPLRLSERPEEGLWVGTEAPKQPTLEDTMARDGPLPLKEALAVLAQVAEAVSFIHGHGLLHGCIAPDHIFISEAGRIGLGWTGEELDADLKGLPEAWLRKWQGFLAPEVRARKGRDSRSDVFSLGMLLHWLMTRSVTDGGGPSGKVPKPVADVIEAATHADPARRIQTVSGLLDALGAFTDEEIEQFQQEHDLAIRAAGFDPRLLWRRHPRALVAFCVLALAATGAGLWLARRHLQAIRARNEALDTQFAAELERKSVVWNYQRANSFYERGAYRDAMVAYQKCVDQTVEPRLVEPSLRQIARCHMNLKDYGGEYTAWMRMLREFPDTHYAGEANERIIRIAALTVARYGDLVDITTTQDIVVDGLPNDWEGIAPVITDKKGDARRGGPPSDLVAMYAAVRGETFYIRIDTAEPPQAGDQFCVAFVLNTFAYEDSSEEWDYQIGVAKGIPPWIWDLRGGRNYANTRSHRLHGVVFAQAQCVEFSFPLAAIGSPTSAGLRVFLNLAGSNAPNDTCDHKVLVKWKLPETVNPPPDTPGGVPALVPEAEPEPGPEPEPAAPEPVKGQPHKGEGTWKKRPVEPGGPARVKDKTAPAMPHKERPAPKDNTEPSAAPTPAPETP